MLEKTFSEMEEEILKIDYGIDLKNINLKKEVSIYEILMYRIHNKIKIFSSTIENNDYNSRRDKSIKLIPFYISRRIIENFSNGQDIDYFLKINQKGIIEYEGNFFLYDFSYLDDLYLSHLLKVKLKEIYNVSLIEEDIFEIKNNGRKNILNLYSTDNDLLLLEENVDEITYIFDNFGYNNKNFKTLKYLFLENNEKKTILKKEISNKFIEERLNNEILKYEKIIFIHFSLKRAIVREKNKVILIGLNNYHYFYADEFLCRLNKFFVFKKKNKCFFIDLKGNYLEENYYLEDEDIQFDKKIYKIKNSHTKHKKIIIFNDDFKKFESYNYRELNHDLFIIDDVVKNEENKEIGKLQSEKSIKILKNGNDKVNFSIFKILEIIYKQNRESLNNFDTKSTTMVEVYKKKFLLEMYNKTIILLPEPEEFKNLKDGVLKNIFFEIAREGHDYTIFLFYTIYEYTFNRKSDIKRKIKVIKNRLHYYNDGTYEMHNEGFYTKINFLCNQLNDLDRLENELPTKLIETLKKYLEKNSYIYISYI
ncbi:hypothetical protein [Fusobacterium gastrosuis]|uniref:hypothetical protein n=1 Tax=Fusobacterium gastrosuis TaxID=1755100 RepID=UPI0029777F61|nr:hypothetical protein [Fusobacteriaceae bacterium]MDY5714192.1 hypothetical protein [Fusobacterium gastrosuis]